ncbi:FAD-dependent oxidoreductase [Sphingosinicella terrae]|uniref:FAD-dependent oxidoreductase n=1 Tax=Sphingosinicella terrae TaxID=2172047 RepID=UPI000E0D91A3|nr:FAD-dependent oxidoreductase [Sphingosinicella terrae]
MAAAARRQSYWNATAPASGFPSFTGDLEVDVAIIGGGIVGVTTASQLKERGLSFALLEARRVGEEVTGKSTAKVTSQHNIKYTTIERKFGEESARHYADANETGLRTVVDLAGRLGIDCSLERRPAFTYTKEEHHVAEIEKEVELARRLGLPASLTRDTGLPFDVLAAMRWDDQAQFHPTRYVKGLAATLPGNGGYVFEGSRVIDWGKDRAATDAGSVRAKHVVMATHLPLGQTGLFYAENHPHMHPVIMGQADPARVPAGMHISVETPHHSLRGHRDENGRSWMIFTGPTFKHGHVDQERQAFAQIERFAAEHFGVTAEYRWTNEDYTPMDHAPFVGWSSGGAGACLVATGFDAWGLSMGTAAGILLADIIADRANPWLDLFDARRIKPIAGAKDFLKANAEVAADLVGGYLSRKPHGFDDLRPGEGAVLKVDGHNVAGYRDEGGALHAVSAVCTHMGCIVGWNETDRTWDCPCHGSRFGLDGAVIHGPAVKPLAPHVSKKDQASRSA